MSRLCRILSCGVLIGLLGVLLPLAASAHEHRAVANGKYTMIVGFLNEPTFAGQQNSLDLTVETTPPNASQSGKPILGLDRTLKAEAIYQGNAQKLALTLTPREGVPGAYDGVFFPMKAGDYSFHIYGTIEGANIDETFTTSPNTFGPVLDPAPYELPQTKSSSTTGGIFGTLDPGGFAGNLGELGGGWGGLAASLVVLIGAAGLWSVRRRRAAVASA